MLHHDSLTLLQREPCTKQEKKFFLSVLSSHTSSFAPWLHEEADTIMFAHATEAAKRADKKISSRTVGTDGVVLVILVLVQQLRVDELCVGKNLWPSLV